MVIEYSVCSFCAQLHLTPAYSSPLQPKLSRLDEGRENAFLNRVSRIMRLRFPPCALMPGHMHTLDHKIPPPAVMLLFAASMWLLSASESSMALALPWRQTLAITVWCLGITISLAGVLEFWRAKTTINPLNPEAASAMVTSGIYHYSRNPMYVGLLFALVGWALWLSHLIAFALLPFFVLYINRFQIEPEERALAAKFGEEFRQYRSSVRRWL